MRGSKVSDSLGGGSLASHVDFNIVILYTAPEGIYREIGGKGSDRAGPHIESLTVPGTPDLETFELALIQRPLVVGAYVVYGVELTVYVAYRNHPVSNLYYLAVPGGTSPIFLSFVNAIKYSLP